MASASTSKKPLQEALAQIIQRASLATSVHTDPAVTRVASSQNGLEAELERLDAEMAAVTSVSETMTLDPETSARMQQTQECLKRTKKKLITIRGRLGRLRAYEESDRLQLTERSVKVIRDAPSIQHDVDRAGGPQDIETRVTDGDRTDDARSVQRDLQVGDAISPESDDGASRTNLQEGDITSPEPSLEAKGGISGNDVECQRNVDRAGILPRISN